MTTNHTLRRVCVVVICCVIAGCADSIEQAAREAYELTLPAPSDGSGWSIRRDAGSRVATWQIRINRSWNDYAAWVRTRMTTTFDAVVPMGDRGILFKKSLKADQYTLEIRVADPPQAGYVTATFTARPF